MSLSGRRIALATKHGKEAIFAPAFAELGASITVADVDTDRFGTFSGDIARPGSPLEVVELKARAATCNSGLDLGVASEGTFGPHPVTPYLLVDTELVAYVDTGLDYCVVERATSASRLPPAATVDDIDDIDGLRITALLPDQWAVVVAEDPDTRSRTVFAKGIDSVEQLRSCVEHALSETDSSVIVEPDLRSHGCPERRQVIERAVARLVGRLRRSCPVCEAPGFGSVRVVPGLRCGLCDLPTTQPAADLDGCVRCGFEVRVDRVARADPTYCDRCNP